MKLFAALTLAALAAPALAAPAPDADAADVSNDKRFLSCAFKGVNCRDVCAQYCYKDTGLFTLGSSCFLGFCKCFTPEGRKVRWPAWEIKRGTMPDWPSACGGGGCKPCSGAVDWYSREDVTDIDPEA